MKLVTIGNYFSCLVEEDEIVDIDIKQDAITINIPTIPETLIVVTSITIDEEYESDLDVRLRGRLKEFFAKIVQHQPTLGQSLVLARLTELESAQLRGYQGVMIEKVGYIWIARILGNTNSSKYWLMHWHGPDELKATNRAIRIMASAKVSF